MSSSNPASLTKTTLKLSQQQQQQYQAENFTQTHRNFSSDKYTKNPRCTLKSNEIDQLTTAATNLLLTSL